VFVCTVVADGVRFPVFVGNVVVAVEGVEGDGLVFRFEVC
jgi:hypothetical protein